MTRVLVLASSLALMVALAVVREASAQLVPCGKRDAVQARLLGEYGERPRAFGLAGNGAVWGLVATDDGATWSIVVTRPDGLTCMVAEGQAWQPAKPPPVEERPS